MKSIQQQIFSVMKSLTGQNNILTIPKALIDYTGNIKTALLLSQLLYWTDKSSGEYIYKTNQEWKDEIHLTRYALEKARKTLELKGILKCQVKQVNGSGSTAVHYKLDIEKFVESFLAHVQNSQAVTQEDENPQTCMNAGNAENNIPDENPQTRMNTGNAENNIRECRKQHSGMPKTTFGNAENSIPSIAKITTKITTESARVKNQNGSVRGPSQTSSKKDKYEDFYL